MTQRKHIWKLESCYSNDTEIVDRLKICKFLLLKIMFFSWIVHGLWINLLDWFYVWFSWNQAIIHNLKLKYVKTSQFVFPNIHIHFMGVWEGKIN